MVIIEKLKQVLKLMGSLKNPVIHSYYARKQKTIFFSVKVLRKALADSTYSSVIENDQQWFMYHTNHTNH